jgi:hypothetical protein
MDWNNLLIGNANLLLTMDVDTLNESATALWAIIGAIGGTTLISILTFIKTSVSGKKFRKMSDFAVVADQSMKFAKGEMLVAKDRLVEETKKTIVEPMGKQVEALMADNAQLASLTVTLLSYVQLPLEVKKDAVAVIGALGNISSGVKVLFDTSVKYQEKQEALKQTQNTELQDNIDNI